MVNTIVELLEQSVNTRSDLSAKEKAAKFIKKCSVKEYFDKLTTGTSSARGFVKQLFIDEVKGPNSCPAKSGLY